MQAVIGIYWIPEEKWDNGLHKKHYEYSVGGIPLLLDVDVFTKGDNIRIANSTNYRPISTKPGHCIQVNTLQAAE